MTSMLATKGMQGTVTGRKAVMQRNVPWHVLEGCCWKDVMLKCLWELLEKHLKMSTLVTMACAEEGGTGHPLDDATADALADESVVALVAQMELEVAPENNNGAEKLMKQTLASNRASHAIMPQQI